MENCENWLKKITAFAVSFVEPLFKKKKIPAPESHCLLVEIYEEHALEKTVF